MKRNPLAAAFALVLAFVIGWWAPFDGPVLALVVMGLIGLSLTLIDP